MIEFKASQSSRQNRKEYFENLVIQNPSDSSLKIKTKEDEREDSDLTMIGFVRESYYKYLNEKFLSKKEQSEFYFYFHAIKNGKVYTLHKETNKAKYLRLTLTDFYKAEIINGEKYFVLEPWNSEVLSIELISKQKLQEVLNDFEGNDNFTADYYYLVKARILHYKDDGVKAISTSENDIISPYSPKIVELDRNL